jgi:RNA polymerase sigma-70 factor (ECF subfamily)
VSLTSTGDADLVARVAAGDAAAIDQLVSALRRRVFVVLLGRIRDPETAREITQDVLVAVVDALKTNRVREPERIAAFAHGVARNLANNHIRSRGQEPVWVELTEQAVWVDAEEEAQMAERRRLFREALGRLEETDRTILTMTVLEGHGSKDVAASLGLTDDVVRTRKSRALKRVTEDVRGRVSHSSRGTPLIDDEVAPLMDKSS